MTSRIKKTAEVIEDEEALDALRSFIAVQARSWVRRQVNETRPVLLRMLDEARDSGDKPDVAEFIRKVWLNRELPLPNLSEFA